MPLFVILAICITFSLEPPVTETVAAPGYVAVATLCGMLVVALFAEACVTLIAGRLRAARVARWQTLRLFSWLRRIQAGLHLGMLALAIFWLRWPVVVWGNWRLRGWILGGDLLVLAPFVIPLLWSWWAYYRVERLIQPEGAGAAFHSAWDYVSFQTRHQLLLILLPVLAFLALGEAVDRCWPNAALQRFASTSATVASLGVAIAGYPLLIRWCWAARPLPRGELRARLAALSQRMCFRASDILVWDTRGTMVNAAVVGALPFFRYVLLSDGMLEEMTPEEIEAVFGHEIAHVRFRHLPFYICFVLGSLAAGGLIETGLQRLQVIPTKLLDSSFWPWVGIGLYVWLVFGYLSRQFERQADLHGCRAVSCGSPACPPHHRLEPSAAGPPERVCLQGIETFVNALEKVAAANGISRKMPSWRHFSIAKRVEFLRRVLDQPVMERRLERSVLILKASILGLMLGAGGYLLFQLNAGQVPL